MEQPEGGHEEHDDEFDSSDEEILTKSGDSYISNCNRKRFHS